LLFVQVVLHGSDDAHGLHQAAVGAVACASVPGFATGVLAALIGRQDGEDALIGLADRPDFASRIGGEAFGGGAGVPGLR
jgi:hypothetical protein